MGASASRCVTGLAPSAMTHRSPGRFQVGPGDARCVRHAPGLELCWAAWSGEWTASGSMGTSFWPGGEGARAPGWGEAAEGRSTGWGVAWLEAPGQCGWVATPVALLAPDRPAGAQVLCAQSLGPPADHVPGPQLDPDSPRGPEVRSGGCGRQHQDPLGVCLEGAFLFLRTVSGEGFPLPPVRSGRQGQACHCLGSG